MCRLIAIPPGTKRNEALEILDNMEGGNTDGYGESFVKNGKFVLRKWGLSFSEVWKEKKYVPLSHLPYDGWTIAHQRASTHGHICKANSHPFIIDDKWSFCHNGVWSNHELVRAILRKQGKKFNSDVDSETAGQVFSTLGPSRFNLEMDSCGVFLALNINGELHVVKTSGQLELNQNANGTILLASDLEYRDYPESIIASTGWYRFDKNGRFIKYVNRYGKSNDKIPEFTGYGYQYNSSSLPSAYQKPSQFAARQQKLFFGGGEFIDHEHWD